ncbi:Uncharacterised protein [Streptococcus pneumoniae]|nr:Uncharacterised protein [Streptococcus pneumoniae]
MTNLLFVSYKNIDSNTLQTTSASPCCIYVRLRQFYLQPQSGALSNLSPAISRLVCSLIFIEFI